ncbi:MAG: hypothetical protein EB117_17755 [Betaproteobacteria bacterium]|nr:hypothetical protein [Betaproteobacteria bacterium]
MIYVFRDYYNMTLNYFYELYANYFVSIFHVFFYLYLDCFFSILYLLWHNNYDNKHICHLF